MQYISFDMLSFVWFIVLFSAIWVIPVLCVVHAITPHELTKRYFKEPHFNFGETVILSNFPGSLFRTLVFMGGCVSRRYRTGRKLENYMEIVPLWYVRTSKIYIAFLFFHLAFLFGLLAILFI